MLVVGILERVGAIARDGISAFLDSIASLVVTGVLGIFDTIGFVVGLVLLPLWTLSVVRDGRFAARPGWPPSSRRLLRADAMALLTIVHRALGTFLRVQLAAAGAVGVAVYVGLQGVERAEIATYPAAIAVAAFMGTAQVIPQLGGLIGALPIGLLALARQDEPAATVALLVVYVVALQLVKMAVGARLGRDLNVRPAIALPAFAVISQIGLVWLLLSAPILVIARNTVALPAGPHVRAAAAGGCPPGPADGEASIPRVGGDAAAPVSRRDRRHPPGPGRRRRRPHPGPCRAPLPQRRRGPSRRARGPVAQRRPRPSSSEPVR